MKEQSDTPRTDSAARQATGKIFFHLRGWVLANALERELATATRERDEARAEVSEMEGALRASGALNQKLLDEVDRLRPLTICGCGDHFAINFEGTCPNCLAAGKGAKP